VSQLHCINIRSSSFVCTFQLILSQNLNLGSYARTEGKKKLLQNFIKVSTESDCKEIVSNDANSAHNRVQWRTSLLDTQDLLLYHK
jgi:hypothetical protein